MSHIGEFDLIGRIAAACHLNSGEGLSSEESGVVGIGDDCAVIPQQSGFDTLVTTDLLIEGRHFLLEDVTPYELGWKSAAVNISDIAAMGGRPTASFLSIALPKDLAVPSTNKVENVDGGLEVDGTAEWVDRFIAGFNDLSSRFGVALLGGDTSASPDKLFINVTVLGECPHGQAVKRSGAHPGDLICITGPLGDSAAGLKLVLERARGGKLPSPERAQADLRCAHPSQPDGWAPPVHVATGGYGSPERVPETADHPCDQVSPEVHGDVPPGAKMAQIDAGGPSLSTSGSTTEDYLIRRHYLPVPRVELGRQLAALPGVHAMMDISDGIASDLRHILKASGVPDVFAGTEGPATSVLANSAVTTHDSGLQPSNAGPSVPSPVMPGPLGAEIDLKALPLSDELCAICAERGWDPYELAVGGGEDYELLFTAEPGTELPEGCTVIGRIVVFRSEPGMTVEKPAGSEPSIHWIGSAKDYKGFTHF